jgi:hypothetical protein
VITTKGVSSTETMPKTVEIKIVTRTRMAEAVTSRVGHHGLQSQSLPKAQMTNRLTICRVLKPKFRQSRNSNRQRKRQQLRRKRHRHQRCAVAVCRGRNQHRQNPLNPLKPTMALTLLS